MSCYKNWIFLFHISTLRLSLYTIQVPVGVEKCSIMRKELFVLTKKQGIEQNVQHWKKETLQKEGQKHLLSSF